MVRWAARRWLALWLVGAALLVALPFAAPLLAAAGHAQAAGALYALFRPMCHQFPDHSWFLGGPAPAYGWRDLQAALGLAATAWPPFHRPIADPRVGYQLAVCQRDIAIYVGLFVASALYAARLSGRPLGWRGYAACLAPIAIDGLTQLAGLRESTPLLRTITGAVFGAGTALFALPQIDAARAAWHAPEPRGG